jgi:signal transduction histidine kinase
VKDSLQFLEQGVGDLKQLIDVYRAVAGDDPRVKEAEAAADLEFLLENLPQALARSSDGVNRINVIVRAMKDFAYPEQKTMVAVDLNRGIQSTLVLAASEYKLVADLETDLSGDLPQVMCHPGEINQAVLNIVINAAHAVSDAVKAGARRGKIAVRTRAEGDSVLISVTDTGGGIPPAVQGRIFDPFFTTKEAGRGTGQGLAIARDALSRHGGDIRFETQVGAGTTFFIRLPLDATSIKKAA